MTDIRLPQKITVNHNSPGNNQHRMSIGSIRLAFSYDTLIGISEADDEPWVTRVNTFHSTTGRHTSALDGGTAAAKAARLSPEEFDAYVAEVLFRRGMRI